MNLLEVSLNSEGKVLASRRKRTAPCERRLQEKLEVLAEVKAKDPGAFFWTMGQLALNDYWFYLRVICDYRHLDPWDHGEELVHFIMSNWGKPMMILLPRDGGKSSCVTVPLIPWLLPKNPVLTSIISNAAEEKANAFAAAAAKIICSKNYQACYGLDREKKILLKPSERWGNAGYYLQPPYSRFGGAVERADPNIAAYSVRGNIAGSHVGCLIHDDLLNEETHLSDVEQQRAKRFVKESFNVIESAGQMLVLATRWTYGDVYGDIESGKLVGKQGRFVVFKRGAERIVTDDAGEPMVELFNPRRTFIDFRGTEQIVGYTKDMLDNLKTSLGSKYYALYQNTPVSDEDRIFAIDQVKPFLQFPGELGPVFRVGVEVEGPSLDFFEALKRLMKEDGKNFNLEKITNKKTSGGKLERIRGIVQPVIDSGRLFVRSDLWNLENNVGQEIREFDKGEDDALDALAICIARAPKHTAGTPAFPYIAVDPAFSAKRLSNSMAVLCGCWFEDNFYILDCYKFKAQKTDLRCRMIFRMHESFNQRPRQKERPRISRRIESPGNEREKRTKPSGIIWGDGLYTESEPLEHKQ